MKNQRVKLTLTVVSLLVLFLQLDNEFYAAVVALLASVLHSLINSGPPSAKHRTQGQWTSNGGWRKSFFV
jgi:hypothetical protein